MYNSQEIADRIKSYAKVKGVSINQMLSQCGLSKNTIAKMNNGTDILTHNFAKIADYLDVSVDYLLGRTTDTSPAVIPYNGVSKSSIDLPLDITTDDMELINFILSKYK